MENLPLAYSIAEACVVSSIGRTTLYAAIKSGELQARKVGRRTLITAPALISWLNSRPTEHAGTAGGSTLATSKTGGDHA
jgi:excisionase family DNA binding protein